MESYCLPSACNDQRGQREKKYSDRCEDNAGVGKGGSGRRNAEHSLRVVHDRDCRIKPGENKVSPLLLLVVGTHGPKVDAAGEKVAASRLRGRFRTPRETGGGNYCSASHDEPFKGRSST